MKYILSKFMPLRFTSAYSVVYKAGSAEVHEAWKSSWWQWNDKVYAHKVVHA